MAEENENSAVKTNKPDTESRKSDFLSAISSPRCLGIVSNACKEVGINRSTYYDWREKDEDFANKSIAAQQSGRDSFDDEVEQAVYDLIQDRNPTIVTFYAKTRLKNRGFAEKQEIDISTSTRGIDINVIAPERG